MESKESELEIDTFKICVVGLGRVGIPLALTLSKKASIIGFDTRSERIERLMKLATYREEILGINFSKLNLHLTDDPKQINNCNFVIISVPVPFNEERKPNHDPLLYASKIVGSSLQKGTIVIYEYTLFPGATKEIFIPILEKYSSLTSGVDFFVGYSPGSIKTKYREHKPSNTVKVVAGHNKDVLDNLIKIYSLVFEKVHPIHSITLAEASIIIDNLEPYKFTALLNELVTLIDDLEKDDRIC